MVDTMNYTVSTTHNDEPVPIDNANVSVEPDEIAGWRLALIFFGLSILLVLAFMDETIVATALVVISVEFNDFSNSLWVVLAYTITFLGFTVLANRLADVYGRRSLLLAGAIIFTAFSLAAGFAQSMNQLIAFRALQGVGGSLLYSVGILCFPEMSPLRLLPLASSIVGIVLAVANSLGPVLGGAFTSYTSWRWIFWVNPPIAIPAIALLFWAWPNDPPRGAHLAQIAINQIDWIGVALLLLFTTLFTFSIQQAGTRVYSWDSPMIIAFLVVAAVALLALLLWSWMIPRVKSFRHIAEVLPWRLLTDRVLPSAVMMTLLIGFASLLVVVWLPIFFQIVNVLSAVQAGIHLLPSVCLSAAGAAVAGLLSAQKNNLFATNLLGHTLAIIAGGLFSILPSTLEISPICYVAQVMGGFGAGLIFTVTVFMVSLNAEFRDHAVGQGLIAQARVLGGTLGVAMASALFADHIGGLTGVLSEEEIQTLYRNPAFISQLDLGKQIAVRQAFADSWNEALRITIYVAAASFVVCLCSWQKTPPSIETRKLQLEAAIKNGPTDNVGMSATGQEGLVSAA